MRASTGHAIRVVKRELILISNRPWACWITARESGYTKLGVNYKVIYCHNVHDPQDMRSDQL
jgi:hypothetical protein